LTTSWRDVLQRAVGLEPFGALRSQRRAGAEKLRGRQLVQTGPGALRAAAVILGHVDSKRGPGVSTGSGHSVFQPKLIYRHSGGPGILLITCDGRFDSSTGHYVENYVVFARQPMRNRR
jgi:hypothetical protein